MKRAIVLSGGGAKGAYEIGVWKALKKLHIKYDIVTGTSVGALNGALMVQNTFLKAYLLWLHIDFSLLFQKEELKEYQEKKDARSLVRMYAKNVMSGGMNVEELENLVRKYLNPKKIKKANTDFGIITVNSKTLKPKVIKKESIDITKLCDYLIASASCYPFFKKKDIEKNQFMDGGFYDNLPINLAIELGADEIIAVDLKAIGRKQKVKDKNIPITYIAPRNNIGNFLVFDKVQAKEAIDFGYNDTMKVYGYLEGDLYTFHHGQLEKNYQKNREKLKEKLKEFFTFHIEESITEELLKIASYKRLSKSKEKDIQTMMNDSLEVLGKSLDMKQNRIYRISIFHQEIRERIKRVKPTTKKSIESGKIPATKEIIQYFNVALNKAKHNPKTKKELCALSLVFPKEFLAAIYLHMLEDTHEKAISL